MLSHPANALIRLTTASLLIPASIATAQGSPEFAWQRGGHVDIVYALTYSPTGDFFVSASTNQLQSDKTIKVWRASDGMLLKTLVAPEGTLGLGLAVSRDRRWIAASRYVLFAVQGQVDIWG